MEALVKHKSASRFMTERLLQFIWQFRHYNQQDLTLESGEALMILFPGHFNNNQGPDFLHGKIRVDETTWVGNIELHLRGSQWKEHEHGGDRNYDNVILHVVWENDVEITDRNIPTLLLGHRIPGILLEKYKEWMNSPFFIPCHTNIHLAEDLIWISWKERILLERLERKTSVILEYLQQSRGHWEEILWWLIASNFGIKVNSSAFESMARSISIQILARHKKELMDLEALLMGQAGLLEKTFTDNYPILLQKEYAFFKAKYQLQPIFESLHYLRMRPVNFPTIRLSQLASLIQHSSHLFSKIMDTESVPELRDFLSVQASSYWDSHFVFDEATTPLQKFLGSQMVDNIIINTIAPVVFAYGHLHKEKGLSERALQWLQEIPGEKNSITDQWKELGVEIKSAFDSQALIELKHQYCDKKRCLECTIGNYLLKSLNK